MIDLTNECGSMFMTSTCTGTRYRNGEIDRLSI
ncbi:hypothetical protein R69888_01717 [Paraburkholderia haematera]|uniref:Uncharacterized protein n=1 Tax=Paraburkholderia haematera TaxID=2793077 RepID=A0ABN7L447_9BURK|nr:hypothetical protein R69888_01717 [Paraburkholderia haematera]